YENIPIPPYRKPLNPYTRVSGTMIRGGGKAAALVRARAAKKGVFNSSLRELGRMRTLAPASQAQMIEAHAQAIRDLEKEIDSQPNSMTCGLTTAPPG